jgi:hypothetical protein
MTRGFPIPSTKTAVCVLGGDIVGSDWDSLLWIYFENEFQLSLGNGLLFIPLSQRVGVD